MRLRVGRLLVLLLVGISERGYAQRAGLWEERFSVDGVSTGVPARECRVANAQLDILRAWPPNCVAKPLLRTSSGVIAEAQCSSGRAGTSLVLRRTLIGDLERHFLVITSSQIQRASMVGQAAHRSVVAFHYLGSCTGSGSVLTVSEGAARQASSRESLPIMLVRIMTPVLVLGSIAAVGWFFRRRWREQRDRATVANIVTDAAGAATIPVLVTYTGVRGLPWWYGIAMNNAKPLFAVEADGIRFRVVRQQRRLFTDMQCVDVRQGKGTVNVDFTFHGSLFTFAANVGTVALAAHVIASLPTGVPLSPRAQALRAVA